MPPYNRVLGVIYLEDMNVNLEMIKAGYAEVYQGKPPRGFDIKPYIETETKAKQAKREIWSLGNKYMSPKVWRKMHKNKAIVR